MNCDRIGAGISWDAAVAYAGADFHATAMVDFEIANAISIALDWDPLTSDSLEKELELTPAQKARIDDLRARYKSEEELWRSHSLLESEVDRKLKELRERYLGLIRRELSPEQRQTYERLDGESFGKRLADSARVLNQIAQEAEPSEP